MGYSAYLVIHKKLKRAWFSDVSEDVEDCEEYGREIPYEEALKLVPILEAISVKIKAKHEITKNNPLG